MLLYMKKRSEFMKKTVLITGASRGLGAYIAKVFAKNNHNIIFNYNNSEEEALKLLMEREDSEIVNLYKEIARHSSIYADLKLRLINIRKNGTEE